MKGYHQLFGQIISCKFMRTVSNNGQTTGINRIALICSVNISPHSIRCSNKILVQNYNRDDISRPNSIAA